MLRERLVAGGDVRDHGAVERIGDRKPAISSNPLPADIRIGLHDQNLDAVYVPRNVQRGRIVLIFVAVAALLGGGLYFLFGVHLPGKAHAGARDEIERWEERFAKARRCLLGETPVSSSNSEQLAVFELANEIADRRPCTPLISGLGRGDADDTGIEAVEARWRELERAVSAVAGGFAAKLDPRGDAAGATDKLAGALDRLEAAQRSLREAAGMDPPAAPSGTPLPKAELVPIGATKLDAWLRPSAGGLVALASTGNDNALDRGTKSFQVVLVPGQSPRVTPIGPHVVASITDPGWGASSATQIAVGSIAAGEPTTTASLPAAKAATPAVLFAVGGAADGVIGYVPETEKGTAQVGFARVANGKLVTEPLHDAARYAFALDPPNRALLAWSSGGALAAAIIKPGTPTKIVALGSGEPGQSCMTSTHGWVSSPPQFVSFDDAGARPHLMTADSELIECDATSALLRGAGHRYAICTHDDCRLAELMARPLAMPALMGGQVIAVATRRGVLGVWREKGPPLYFAMPEPVRVNLVHANAKQIDLIGSTDKGLVIVRVSL
jgi:hypothetical protein